MEPTTLDLAIDVEIPVGKATAAVAAVISGTRGNPCRIMATHRCLFYHCARCDEELSREGYRLNRAGWR
jgi:hypothetical protein